MIGPRVNHASIEMTEGTNGPESGFGAGLVLGYGVNDHLVAFLRGDVTGVEYENIEDIDPYRLGQIDLGVRYAIASAGDRFRPYGEIAGTYVVKSDDLDVTEYTFTGGAATLGAGVEYFFLPRFSADLGVEVSWGKLTSGEYGGEEVDIDEKIATTRITLGVNWRPVR
jgi:hypothetical protein